MKENEQRYQAITYTLTNQNRCSNNHDVALHLCETNALKMIYTHIANNGYGIIAGK